jgi:hypothetical protein
MIFLNKKKHLYIILILRLLSVSKVNPLKILYGRDFKKK